MVSKWKRLDVDMRIRTTEVTWAEINIYRGRQNADWSAIPKDIRGSRGLKTFLQKNIEITDKAEKEMIEQIEQSECEDVNISKIFQLKNKKWLHVGYQCQECRKVFSDENIRLNHKYVCRRINKVIREKEKED